MCGEGWLSLLTHHLQRLVHPVGAVLSISQRGAKLAQTPKGDSCGRAVGPRAGGGTKARHQVAYAPEGLHDDARAVGEISVAHGGAEDGAASLLDEEVGVGLAHARRAVGVEDGDDDAGGVDVGPDGPLRAVGEELDAGFEVEAVRHDGAGCVEDAHGVRLDRRHGGVGRPYEVA